MESKDWVALAGVISAAGISCTTLVISNIRERRQQLRDDRLRDEERSREQLALERERATIPRVRVDVECRFLGPHRGRYLTEVRIVIDNVGKVRRVFRHIVITLRGIKSEQPLQRWRGRDESRTLFPEPLMKTDMVPQGDYYFVEPGVQQIFSYVTDMPDDIAFVRAHIKLIPKGTEEEDRYETEFTEERVYAVGSVGTRS